MPTVCLLFNSATAVGDCIFTQFSYLLNIQRKIWDDGEALVSVRDKRETWTDSGIGAGLFVADVEAHPTKGKTKAAVAFQPAPPQTDSAYYTKRGGKFIRGLNDPANPKYAEVQAQKLRDMRRQRTDSNLAAVTKKKTVHGDSGGGSRGGSRGGGDRSMREGGNTVFRLGGTEYAEEGGWGDEEEEIFEIGTFSPRMLVQNKPREQEEPEQELGYPSSEKGAVPEEEQEEEGAGKWSRHVTSMRRSTKLSAKSRKSSKKSEKQTTSQKRMSVFGGGSRGAALLLASPRDIDEEGGEGEEEGGGALLSADGIEYSATETDADIALTQENEDVIFHRRQESMHLYRPSPAANVSKDVLPSAIIKASDAAEGDDDAADPAHAHFSDKHHFDLTDKQRKAMQQQMHRRAHRKGGTRGEKENKQLHDLGASGVGT